MSREEMMTSMLQAQAKQLKMPGLARSSEALARQAREERWSHAEFLHEVLAAEIQSRTQSAISARIRDASFPETKTLDQFDLAKADGTDANAVTQLAKGPWLQDCDNVILAGPIGTGKTHLAIALDIEACKQLRHVRFLSAADLMQALTEARDQRALGIMQRRLERGDLLVLDELGFVPFDRTGGELLFNVLAQRHARRSLMITKNLAFSEWAKVFGGDEKLAAAVLDRLVEEATVVITRGKSFRTRRREKPAS